MVTHNFSDFTNQNLVQDFLQFSARRYPLKTAVVHDNRRMTYADINSKANQLAKFLIKRNIKKGRRIALLIENSPEYIISYYGTLKAGAVVVPISTDIQPKKLEPILHEINPSCIIVSQRNERLLKATSLSGLMPNALVMIRPRLQWLDNNLPIFDWVDIIRDMDMEDLDVKADEEDLASIIYTSGSTGTPKGVMLSHKNIVANTHSICQYLRLTCNDIQMVVLPFYYVMGKSLINTHFAVGGRVVINNRFAYPAAVVQQMIDESVTGFSGVPSTYAYLLHRSPLLERRSELTTLRYCSQAGGHMAKQIKIELLEALPETVKIFIMYGATEASARLSYFELRKYRHKIDSIGKPIPGVSMHILNRDGTEVSVGKTGELVASGENIMRGYWKDPSSTKNVLIYNNYHTGDLGFQDDDGFFYVTGRKDSLLKVGGHRINLQEIEDVLMDTGLITEAVVLGLPDKLLGNQLIALVVSKNGNFCKKDILCRCARNLPKFKLPSSIFPVPTLPKTGSGKINHRKCYDIIKKVVDPTN